LCIATGGARRPGATPGAALSGGSPELAQDEGPVFSQLAGAACVRPALSSVESAVGIAHGARHHPEGGSVPFGRLWCSRRVACAAGCTAGGQGRTQLAGQRRHRETALGKGSFVSVEICGSPDGRAWCELGVPAERTGLRAARRGGVW